MSSEYKICWQSQKKWWTKQYESVQCAVVGSSLQGDEGHGFWESMPQMAENIETSRTEKLANLKIKWHCEVEIPLSGTCLFGSVWNLFGALSTKTSGFCCIFVISCLVVEIAGNVWYLRRWTCEWKEYLKRHEEVPTNHTDSSDCILFDSSSFGSVWFVVARTNQSSKGDSSSCADYCDSAIQRYSIVIFTLMQSRFTSTTGFYLVCVHNYYNWRRTTGGKCCTHWSLELHALFYGQVRFLSQFS